MSRCDHRLLLRARAADPLIPFDFDQALSVFTPVMAKRAGTVFAGAPIVQGNWDGSGTCDDLKFSRGS